MDLDGRQKFFITDFGRLQAYKSRDFNYLAWCSDLMQDKLQNCSTGKHLSHAQPKSINILFHFVIYKSVHISVCRILIHIIIDMIIIIII